jgi:glycerophosphoryl diester phosphodiesterase
MTRDHPAMAAPTRRRLQRPFRAALAGILLAAIGSGSAAAPAFDAQGHRGARGLAPENTLPAFEKALAVGVSTLELDVLLTADDVVVVGHDPVLNPAIVRDAAGAWIPAPGPAVRSLTLSQLQRFDVGRIDPSTPYARTFATQQAVDGTPMPTLAALFDRVKALGADGVHFNIETKLSPLKPEETPSPGHIVRALLKVVRDAGMLQRVTIQSFDWRTLREVQAAEPAVPTAYLSIQTASNDNIRDGRWTAGLDLASHGSVPAMVKAAGGTVWSPNAGALTEPLVRQAKSLGLRVIPWTVNQTADMERLIGWGVDGLITDYPDRLREVMARRGLALPRRHPQP